MGHEARTPGRWHSAARWTALGSCVVGVGVSVAVLVLPWILGEGRLRTWVPTVYAFRTPGLVLIVAGVVLALGLLVSNAFPRSGRTDFTGRARWAIAWLCVSTATYLAFSALGYSRFAFVPAFAMLGFLPALTFRSKGARIAWAIVAGLAAWWSIALASAPMHAGGGKFAGLALVVGLAALAALQFTFAVAGLLRAAFRR